MDNTLSSWYFLYTSRMCDSIDIAIFDTVCPEPHQLSKRYFWWYFKVVVVWISIFFFTYSYIFFYKYSSSITSTLTDIFSFSRDLFVSLMPFVWRPRRPTGPPSKHRLLCLSALQAKSIVWYHNKCSDISIFDTNTMHRASLICITTGLLNLLPANLEPFTHLLWAEGYMCTSLSSRAESLSRLKLEPIPRVGVAEKNMSEKWTFKLWHYPNQRPRHTSTLMLWICLWRSPHKRSPLYVETRSLKSPGLMRPSCLGPWLGQKVPANKIFHRTNWCWCLQCCIWLTWTIKGKKMQLGGSFLLASVAPQPWVVSENSQTGHLFGIRRIRPGLTQLSNQVSVALWLLVRSDVPPSLRFFLLTDRWAQHIIALGWPKTRCKTHLLEEDEDSVGVHKRCDLLSFDSGRDGDVVAKNSGKASPQWTWPSWTGWRRFLWSRRHTIWQAWPWSKSGCLASLMLFIRTFLRPADGAIWLWIDSGADRPTSSQKTPPNWLELYKSHPVACKIAVAAFVRLRRHAEHGEHHGHGDRWQVRPYGVAVWVVVKVALLLPQPRRMREHVVWDLPRRGWKGVDEDFLGGKSIFSRAPSVQISWAESSFSCRTWKRPESAAQILAWATWWACWRTWRGRQDWAQSTGCDWTLGVSRRSSARTSSSSPRRSGIKWSSRRSRLSARPLLISTTRWVFKSLNSLLKYINQKACGVGIQWMAPFF